MHAIRLVLIIVAVLAVLPSVARAQADEPTQMPNIRVSGGVAGFYAQPAGEFADYVDRGFGLNVFGTFPIDQRGIFGVRLEGGVTNYGHERARFPLSPTLGNLIMVDVTTSNNIFFFGLGPQLTAPGTGVRPYLQGTIGGSYFATQSTVEGSGNETPFAQTTNFDDFVFTLSGGGGLLIPIVAGAHPIMIDLGVAYHNNGPTRYLREGSLDVLADESVQITPIESRTSYFSFRVGVATRVGY